MVHARSAIFLALAGTIAVASPVFTVSASGGTHSSLQAAVNDCASSGCRIELRDSAYSFAQPVSIRGKADLQIVGIRRNGLRPVASIVPAARVLDAIPAIGGYTADKIKPVVWTRTTPEHYLNDDGTYTERSFQVAKQGTMKAPLFCLHAGVDNSGAPDSKRPAGWLLTPFSQSFLSQPDLLREHQSGYLHAAVLDIYESKRVTVEGIDFEGEAPMEWITENVWRDSVSHFSYSELGGVVAIASVGSLQTEVRDCEFVGWSRGIRLVDANPAGFSQVDARSGQVVGGSGREIPFSNPGVTGGHRIEGNLAHGNHFFVNMEKNWDLGSSLRFNKACDNGSLRLVAGTLMDSNPVKDDIWAALPGGSLELLDQAYPINLIQGNSLIHNGLDFGWLGDMESNAQLILDNLVQHSGSDVSFAETNGWSATGNRRNNYFGGYLEGDLNSSELPAASFCTTARCEAFTPAWGNALVDSKIAGQGYFGDDLGAVWRSPREEEPIQVHDQTVGYVVRRPEGIQVRLPVPVEAKDGVEAMVFTKVNASRLSPLGVDRVYDTFQLKLPSVDGASATTGINLLEFTIPCAASDSIWRFELAVSGIDRNTGRSVHSNLGLWLLRPLAKQFLVGSGGSSTVNPDQIVEFSLSGRDSLGSPVAVAGTPNINGEGWKMSPPTPVAPGAARTTVTSTTSVQAVAPSRLGLSQVVFWTTEPGRKNAIPGVAYLMVQDGTTGLAKSGAMSSRWKVAGISRRPEGWRIALRGATPEVASDAILIDPSGRTRKPEAVTVDGRSELRVAESRPGTWFLRMGGRTEPVALVR